MTFVCLSGRAAASRVSALKPLVSASVRGGEGVGLGGGGGDLPTRVPAYSLA